MNIVIGSAFRDSAYYIPRYLGQVDNLVRSMSKDKIRLIAVEGDSTDRTKEILRASAEAREIPLDLRTYSHGYPHFGQTESPIRLRELSKIDNLTLEGVLSSDDVFI